MSIPLSDSSLGELGRAVGRGDTIKDREEQPIEGGFSHHMGTRIVLSEGLPTIDGRLE